MTPFRALTDAGGRSVADHIDRLRRSLDSFGRRLRDAVAAAVGDAVSGAVQAALRAALADLAGLAPADDEPPPYGPPSYWGDPYDAWADPGGPHRGPPADDSGGRDGEPPVGTAGRWPLVAFAGRRLLGALLRRLPEDWRRPAAVGVGLLVAVAVVAGLPAAGLARSALTLTALAGALRGGVGAVSQFTP